VAKIIILAGARLIMPRDHGLSEVKLFREFLCAFIFATLFIIPNKGDKLVIVLQPFP
jgi:hypothetical protein